MISYDNYKNRIQKLAKLKRILHKFRFLICGVLALIVGTSVGLMVAKGSYTSGMSLSAQSVMFNEDYDVKAATAFLSSSSDQHIEYRGENGGWTKQKPVKAGKYSARTVTKKIVGYSYSPAVNFEILPLKAEFTIVATSVEYGSIPKYTMPELINGHRVDESVLEFGYETYGAPSTEVNVVESSIKIIDANGDDFTECYVITPHGNTLTVNKKSIIVKTADLEFEYDGKSHFAGNDASEETLGSLVKGDKLTFTTAVGNYTGVLENGAVNAGGYTVSCENIKIMHGDTDISGWYSINGHASRLTINRRKLTITTGDAQKVFDGKPFENTQLTCENLVEGHLAAVNSSTLPKDTTVGTYSNVFDVTVLDGTTDVTRNYEIDKDNSKYGKLTITPAKLTVTTATPEAQTYDGKPFTDFTFEVAERDKFGSGFEFAAVERLENDTTDAGVYDNNFKIVVTLDGKAVTDNFEIGYTYGKLTVLKRAVTVTTVGDTKVYDGRPLTFKEAREDNLAERQLLKIVTPFSVTNVTGEEGVEIAAEFTVIDSDRRDVGKNYDINYKNGKLIIEPLQISVKTVDASREYDGTSFSAANCVITRLNAEGMGLYGTDALFPNFVTMRTDAGSEPNVCRYELPTFDGVRSNYRIVGDIEYGTLTVEPKAVKVTINTVISVYGEQIPDGGFELDCGELPNGEKLTFTTHYEKNTVTCTPETWQGYTLLNAGIYSIVHNDDAEIVGGNARVGNYNITYISGTLEITPRVIYYVTANDTKVYDGTALSNTDYETYLLSDNTKAGLLNGDKFNLLANPTSIIDVQKRPNANYYTAPNNNYYIGDSVFGWLEVTPRPIVIELSAIDDVTYGQTFEYKDEEGNYANSPDLANGEKLKIAVNYKKDGLIVPPKNAGTYTAELDLENCKFYYADGAEIEGGVNNYEIECDPLKNLKIKQFEFEIIPLAFTKENGTALTYGDKLNYPDYIGNYFGFVDGNITQLPYGEDIKILDLYYYADHIFGAFPQKLKVGIHQIAAANIAVYDSDGNEIQRGGWTPYGATENPYLTNYNYLASYKAALEVVPREITVTVKDNTATYGGALPKNSSSVTKGAMQYGETLSLTYKYDREIGNIGEYEIIADKVFIDSKEVDPENCNYTFTFESGTLTVTAAKLTVDFRYKLITQPERIYYGTEWSYPTGKGNYKTRKDTVKGLVKGEDIEIVVTVYSQKSEGYVEKPVDAGRYVISVNRTESKIYAADGSEIENGILNYEITSAGSQLNVERKPITVTFAGNSATYGDDLTDFIPAYTTSLDGDMPYGETLAIGSVIYKQDDEEVTPKNAGEYEIEGGEVLIDGSKDGASNYSVYYEGTLTINKKQVHIKFKDEDHEYGCEWLLQGLATLDAALELADGSTEPALAYGEVLRVKKGYKKDGVAIEGEHHVNNPWRLSVGEYTRYAVEYYVKENEDADRYIDQGTELKNYEIICDEGAFIVTPYTVTVKPNDQTCEYGTIEDEIEDKGFAYTDSWTVKYGMPYGENLILSYSYDPSQITSVGKYAIKATATGVEGGDLNNYEIKYEEGTLTVTRKEIIVKIDDKKCTYGDALPENTYKIYDSELNETVLPNGDVFAITVYGYSVDFKAVTPRNAGSYSIEISTHSITNNGEDVSSNYLFGQYTPGNLTIEKADLKLQLIEVQGAVYGDYRGYPTGKGNFDKENTVGIKYNDNLELAVEYEVFRNYYETGLVTEGEISSEIPTNAAYYHILLDKENSLIHTAEGEEFAISLNYNIECSHRTFLIHQRPVYVQLVIPEYTYGETVAKPQFTIEVKAYVRDQNEISTTELPYGETCDFDFEYEDEDGNICDTPVNAGTYKVNITKKYVNGREDLAENYYFELRSGNDLTIIKKQIEITLDDMTAAYGDFEFTQPKADTFNPTTGVLEYADEITVQIKFTEVGGESTATFITPKNVGTYSVVATRFTVTYSDGEEETAAGDKLKNYEIVCNHGTLEITKKQLHIAFSKEVEIIYGETAPDSAEIPYTVTSEGEIITRLPYDDPLGVACYYQGSVVPVNAGTYTIVYDGAAINLGSGDFNYDITGEDGLLTIKQKEIEVTVKGGTAVYGYENLPEIGYEITDGETVDGEKLVPAFTFGLNGEPCVPVNVGVYEITVDEENCKVEGGNALYGNYKVTYVIDGELEITRAPLTVKIIGDSFVYGERDINVTFEITDGKLFHGDNLELEFTFINKESGDKSGNPTAAGEYSITATAEIVGGNASVDNYEISYDDNEPELIIEKRGIEIVLNRGGVTAFTYGDNYGESICNAQIDGAADGQIITVAVTYTKKEESALRMLRARTLSARAAETLTPKDAGTYIATLNFKACVVTDADGNPVDGGIDNYELSTDCAAVEFVISPMTLTVTVENAQITYGDRLPSILDYSVEEKMPYGESLNLAFSFAGEDNKLPVHKGDYDVTITGAEVSGGNIGNYELDYTNEAPTLTINAKPLTVQLGNLSVSYGAEVNYEVKVGNYEFADELLDGDEFTVTQVLYKAADGTEYGAVNPPANVGTYAIVYVNCTIVNADGENAKGDYTVTGLDGVLIIDSSLITVYTASAEKEYDGTALSTDKYDRYDGDLGDYKLVADKDNICEYIDVTLGDGVDNTTKFKIVDESGNVTENLRLQYGTYGKLKVTRKTAEITIKDASAVYGEYPEIEYTVTGLVDGEELDFSIEFSDDEDVVTPETKGGYFILPVGSYRMNYAANSASIVGGRGKASNYNLVFKPDAAFEVTPRHIAITTASGSAEYSGSAFTKPDGYITEWVVEGERQGLTGLINGDTLTVSKEAGLTDVGSCDNDCTYTVSDNYVIDESMYEYGTLTVTRRTVTAKTADVIETYNGEAHSNGVVTDVDGKLAAGHEFRVTSALVERTDVCSNVENVLTVIIVDTNDGNKDVTDNYYITYSNGKITVNPRPLEITTGGVIVDSYDGNAHGNADYDKADGLLTALGHELVVDDEFKFTNATEGVDNKTTYKVYCGGEDISGNYEIEYKHGKIVIGKTAVTVTLNSGVEVQYGNAYTEALTYGAVTLIDGETVKLAVTVDGGVNGVGTYTAKVDWADSIVSNAKGVIENGADNYEPEFVPATVDFNVIPREIEVTLNADGKTQFAYGDDYDTAIRTVTVDSMVAGETLEVAVTYNVTNPQYVGNYSAALDLTGCSVTGGSIGNYDIVLCDDVDFEIIAREITVDMEDMTARYGETPAYPDGVTGYSVDGLVYGDKVTVTPAFEKDGKRVIPDFAGKYDIVCGGIEVNGGAVDAENYTFETGKKGTLTVDGIGIEIVRKTVTKTYDGTPLALNHDAPETEVTYIINNDESLKLREGYSLVLDGTFATENGNVSSSCANTAKYKVLNADGDEAGEYVVTHRSNDAKLIIEKKIIKVKTDTPDARDYDGTPLKAEGYVITDGELVEGHELKTSGHATLTDAGSIDNTMMITVTAGSEVVTANYDIKVTYGTLTVNKLAVEVNIVSISKVYGEDTEAGKINQKTLVNGEKLIYRLKYVKDGEPCTGLLSVDTYGITADKSTMSVSGGKLSNYEISFNTDATLTVTKRHIIVTTANGETEYSGKAFSKTDDYTTEWIKDGVRKGENGLINGDTLTVTYIASRTEVGSSENDCKYVVTENAENYYIEDYVNGTLSVKKRVISVTTEGISGEYRGTPYTEGGFVYDQTKLLAGHTVARTGNLMEFLDVTDNGENVFAVVITENGTDVTDNYDIKYTYGEVVITKRTLTVTLDGTQTSFAYGENTFDGKFKNVTVEGLAADDELTTVALVYEPDGTLPVNAGDYTAKLDLVNSFITYAGEGNGIGNYNVVCTDVEFTITKRNVTLTLGEWAAEEYDGEAHVYNTSGCGLVTALLNGESLANVAVKYCLDSDGKVALNGAPTNAGTYYVFPDTAETTVNGANGETAIETNYAVTCEPLEFVITPKKLVITLSDVSHTYDGNKYDFASGDGFETNLCDGDEIECKVTYDNEPIKVDTYTVTFDENLVFTSGIADNYELDKANSTLTCTLTINKLEITITVADRDVEKGNEAYTKADVSGDFVEGDLAKAEAEFVYSDEDGNTLSGLPEDTGTYTVTVTLGGEVMDNYDCSVNAGTLIVTERKVLVTPVYGGEDYIYNGTAVNASLFDYTHVHDVAGADGEAGFFDKDLGNIKATFTFTDENGKKYVGITPTNAGTYQVSVKLTTLSGEEIKGYCIDDETTIEFTIAKRELSYTVEVEGAGEYVYSNSRPEFSAELSAYDGFVGGEVPEYTFELFDGENPVTRYNVGTYKVKIAFEGMGNYDVTATTAEIKITARTIVVTPTDPFGGTAQAYDGTNLKLGENDFTLRYGETANGDKLTIVSSEFAPTSKSGNITIVGVNIVDAVSGEDVKGNYTVYSVYNATNATIKGLGLSSIDFRVRAEYTQTDVHYTIGDVFGEDTGVFPYTGKSFVYTFDGTQISKELNFGHCVKVDRNTVTVPAAAGVYPDLICDRVKVYDGNGNNVTAIYNLICDNPEAAEITVTENVLVINLSGVNVADLVSGEKLGCEITGLYEGATPAHTAEVYAYNVDGEWIIGAVVFSTSASGRKTDLSANYKLSASSVLSGATVKILTLDEAELYSRPAIGVEITVTAAQLESGRGTVFTEGNGGRWVLGGDNYTVDGTLLADHELQVLVFVDESGNYTLGVTVFKTENSRRIEAKNSYRLKDIRTTDVSASYITVSDVSDLQRELYIDFNGCTIEEGLLTGYTVKGLNTADNHVIEVTAVDNGDGTFALSVVVYQIKAGSTKKYNKATSYKLVCEAHSQISGAALVTGALS